MTNVGRQNDILRFVRTENFKLKFTESLMKAVKIICHLLRLTRFSFQDFLKRKFKKFQQKQESNFKDLLHLPKVINDETLNNQVLSGNGNINFRSSAINKNVHFKVLQHVNL